MQTKVSRCDNLTLNLIKSKDYLMRFLVIVKASTDSEAGVMPDQALLEAMG